MYLQIQYIQFTIQNIKQPARPLSGQIHTINRVVKSTNQKHYYSFLHFCVLFSLAGWLAECLTKIGVTSQ